MKTAALALAGIMILATTGFAEPPKGKHEIRLNGHTFTLPDGFAIEQIAGPPLVNRPIVADFDEAGHLYVADSSGSNDPVVTQLAKKPHRIVRLDDSQGNGRFDKVTVFADHMMFPEGARWYGGSLYVSAAPSIWKLTDTKGKGVADQRVEWFQGKTLTGCANDLHGPYVGPDGWIYWCKGAFAKQTYERPGRPPFVTRAAHIFRCRPDGTGIEPVMTGGMDNPVHVVFTPGGERIFTTTFLQHPGGGRRDGLIHAVYGGVYGKIHDVLNDHPWTGPEVMPVLDHLGPAAPCGLTRYESRVFGAEYQDNLFACCFNMHKVTRHVLIPDGATFHTRDDDFLVSDNLDFHPTDVMEDADGSLIVLDTGGWYKLCCPTSQLHKPDVLGAIYRVRKIGAPKIEDPRGLKLDWNAMSAEQLAVLLDDPRPKVRKQAIATLGKKGKSAIPALSHIIVSALSVEARRNAVWAAARIAGDGARALARQAVGDGDETVRQVAIHTIGLWRDSNALVTLCQTLLKPSAQNRRAAAEALGRIGSPSAVGALLETVGLQKIHNPATDAERVLEHSLIYAAIEIGDRTSVSGSLKSPNLQVRRAALIALDQIRDGKLEARAVIASLNSSDTRMKEAAWWIAGRHPEWGDAMATVLRDRLVATNLRKEDRAELVHHLARFARTPAVQNLLADKLADVSLSTEIRQTVLRSMAEAGLKVTPETWISALSAVLTARHDLMSDAINAARGLKWAPAQAMNLTNALLAIAEDSKVSMADRVNALAAIPGGLTNVKPALFELLRARLDPEEPVGVRSTAADVLARAKLSSDQLTALADSLKKTGSMEVNRLLEAFGKSTDERVGRQLIAVLKASPAARSGMHAEALKPRFAKFGPAVQQEAESLYAMLNAEEAKQRARLEELLKGLHEGDIRRGQLVFHSAKAACYACHAIGYMGGDIGPDLTRIGRIRTERDLLESIVFPSASFVRSYEPVLVTTKEGKLFNGVIKKDTATEIVLATGPNQFTTISRDTIDAIEPSKVSIMPAGFDQLLTPRELADLVTFLKACK